MFYYCGLFVQIELNYRHSIFVFFSIWTYSFYCGGVGATRIAKSLEEIPGRFIKKDKFGVSDGLSRLVLRPTLRGS